MALLQDYKQAMFYASRLVCGNDNASPFAFYPFSSPAGLPNMQLFFIFFDGEMKVREGMKLAK